MPPFSIARAEAIFSLAQPPCTPESVKVTYPEARGEACAIEEHNVLPAGRTVGVKGQYRKVMLLPTQEEIPFRTENGYTVFELPEITGYQMFCLEV